MEENKGRIAVRGFEVPIKSHQNTFRVRRGLSDHRTGTECAIFIPTDWITASTAVGVNGGVRSAWAPRSSAAVEISFGRCTSVEYAEGNLVYQGT